jgi:antitoxin VapB
MALNIKDPETDRLARELADETGESITEAAKIALTERLERVRAQRTADDRYEAIMRIIRRGRSEPVLDSRSEDEILGYNEFGIPE